MRVGWLHDDPGYLGGAELSMAEFKAAAPDDVEVVECPPGGVTPGLDRYVVGNAMTYPHDTAFHGPFVRYHHDVSVAPMDTLLAKHQHVRHIFASPLQRKRMEMEGECIPPALDLDRFRAVVVQGKNDDFTDDTPALEAAIAAAVGNGHRKGAVCVGRMAYGKGLELLAEYEEPVDVYSTVPFPSEGNAFYRGAAEDVPKTLASYERFVFLPTALEPFGRAVVEAWAAGLTLVVNKNVGAMHYILNAQEKLHSAGEDFWNVVLA